MINSRAKGKRGELAWASELRAMGYDGAHRGAQYQGGPDSPDVADGIPGTHCEVKYTERLDLPGAMAQAIKDAGDSVPYVAHRRARHPWLVTVRASDLRRFAALVHEGEE